MYPTLTMAPELMPGEAMTAIDAEAFVELVTQAACIEADPTIFFSDDMSVVARAKQVCADCPVRQQCLAGALERREPHGVWGGELFEAGAVIERKRPRGRPRKHPLPVDAPEVERAA
ncbi:WhiB family transcriptional regulator [Luteococcus peritonei]|uniref:Transcriptional regulator WhiB n=1 Tax=Luteococcus peritonei TaxID=88874 RepID=A0ABW4RX78_9ACTN